MSSKSSNRKSTTRSRSSERSSRSRRRSRSRRSGSRASRRDRDRRRRRSRSRSRSRGRRTRRELTYETPSRQTETGSQVTPAQISTILRGLISASGSPAATATTLNSNSARSHNVPQQMLRGKPPEDLKFRCMLYKLRQHCVDDNDHFTFKSKCHITHNCYDSNYLHNH